jgi:hypothetical protein
MLRHAAHVQTEMTRDPDRHLALKASMALAGTARVMMQLHSLGTQNTIEVTLRPHQDLPEDELHARIAARTQGVVIDLPT